MKIKVINPYEKYVETIEFADGTTIREIAEAARNNNPNAFPYTILLGKSDRDGYLELDESPGDGDNVELLDMRCHSAELAYIRTLSMIYLKAGFEVFARHGISGMDLFIDNCARPGLFTELIADSDADEAVKQLEADGISEELLEEIEIRMNEIVEADIHIGREIFSRDQAIEFWKNSGYTEKATLLERECDENLRLTFYSLDGYVNTFFGAMVTYTGDIEHFKLVKYRDKIIIRLPDADKPDRLGEFHDDVGIFDAFDDDGKWLEILGCIYQSDVNKRIAEKKEKDMILLSEVLHDKKIADIADEITVRRKRIVLIAGPSSSGKTTFARRLCIQLRVNGLNPLYLGTDHYFIDRADLPVDENGERNYENLDAVDIDLFCSNMNDLLAGKTVDIPEFEFIEGKKIFGKHITRIDSSQPIVIEGIHALNGRLTEIIDEDEKYKIFICPFTEMNIDRHNCLDSNDARMIRRMARDFATRGRSAAVTLKDWPKVRAGENVNIFPYNGEADVVFNSTLSYEMSVLRKYAEPILKQVKPDENEYCNAQQILMYLQLFHSIENDDIVPNTSIIREFIGGSVFTE